MEPGTLLADRFEIERVAGSGGMGTVYRAVDRLDGQPVAVKVLRHQGEDEAARFVREARVLSELRHPGIVKYVAHGLTGTGELFLAMEWLEGEDLAQRLHAGIPTVAEGVGLVARAAEILAVAHARGVVHRDVKPSNLFLVDGRFERLKVLDFGLARFEASTVATRTGVLLGTPGYMAPEQARGEKTLDARADVFALGCVLFECLTGRPPFVGEHAMAILAKILLEDAPRLRDLRSGLPDGLEDLVARMLAKSPSARPRDAAAVAEELAALGSLGDVRSRPSRPVPSALTTGEQRLLSAVLVGAGPGMGGAAGIPATREMDPDLAPTLGPGDDASPLATLRAAAEAYGARLERLLDGSAALVLWGTGAATDQAARAARCALAVRALAPAGPMALATGLGVAGGHGPVGEVIDRAARLLRSERGTDIRIDEVTAGLLDVRFVVVDREGLVLEGERETADETRTLLGKPTPCVGRERELGVLSGLWQECVEEPTARPVLVTAPAGVGKSRLRHEFVRRLRKGSPEAEVWIARGDPLGAGSPFALVGQAIRGACGVRDGEALAVRRNKVRQRVARNVAGPDHQRVTEFLGEIAGVGFPEEESVQLRAARQNPIIMGDQMRRAWEDFLLAECSAHPVLLVIEDLHWGDLPTVGFVDSALRNLRDRPFLVLALARPEVHDVFPRLWEDRRLQEIRLDELSHRASEKLVRAVLGKIDSDVIGRLVERAAGNAFFLEELIRAEAEGKGREAPPTVLAMVEARIEALPTEARRVLRAASVFGQASWGGGVLALLGGETRASEAREWLADLVAREVLLHRGEGRFPGEEEYAFRHAIVRDAAYEMLTQSDRTLGHRLAGEWLELAGEGDAVVLAEHFERGSEPGRAVAWYRRAAGQALEGNDFAAAIARVDRGVACGAAGEELGVLRLHGAEAHRWRGEHAEAERCGREAMRALPEGSALWYAAVGEVAIASGWLGHHTELGALGEALVSRSDVQTAGPFAGAAARVGIQLLHAARFDLADALLARIDETAPEAARTAPAAIAWIHFAKATRAQFGGDAGEYLRLCEAAAASAEEAGDLRYACLQRINTGYARCEVGQYARAEEVLREALVAAERLGLPNLAATAKNNLGFALARRGRLDEARSVEAAAVEDAARQGIARLEGASRIYLAAIHALSGGLEKAEVEARLAVGVLGNAPPLRLYALGMLAQVLLSAGRVAEAIEPAEEAWRGLEALGAVSAGESLVRLAHAEALTAAGRIDEAARAIAAARDRLLERSKRISDPSMRQSFLENVLENARTLHLAGRRPGGNG